MLGREGRFRTKSTRFTPLGPPAFATTFAVGPPITPPAVGEIRLMVPVVTFTHWKVVSSQTSLALHTGQLWATHDLFWHFSLAAQIRSQPPGMAQYFCSHEAFPSGHSHDVPVGQIVSAEHLY